MQATKLRVGLLGGTFNPVHSGHVSIAQSFLKSGRIDELWILPSAYPPHKNSEELLHFDVRIEMLKLAFGSEPNVRIRTIESELTAPGYTLQTLEYLRDRYPDHLFFWCIGSDSLMNFSTWYRYHEILKGWKLLVAKRKNLETELLPGEILERSIFVQHEPLSESSSDIRRELKETGSSRQVPTNVLDFIQKKRLYI